jgi:hypothetical protein
MLAAMNIFRVLLTMLTGATLICADIKQEDREALVAMFDNIAKKTKWDMTKPMLWGYFFTNTTREPLEKCKVLLVGMGYRYVDLHENDKLWWLHVEKEEVHTVDSLFNRSNEFYKFAYENKITSYDGMDVGPITK